MNVNEAYKFLQFLSRKNQIGNLTPTEFGQVFNSAQRQRYNTLLGPPTLRPHTALGQNERISEKLKPFKINDATATVTTGVAAYPTGFHRLTAMVHPTTGIPLQFLDDAKLKKRLKSAIDPIADVNPGAYTNAATGWNVFPSTLATVKISYYKLPTDVLWAYTIVSGRPVYDVGNSVQPQWDETEMEEILSIAAGLLGVSFNKGELVQYAQSIKSETV